MYRKWCTRQISAYPSFVVDVSLFGCVTFGRAGAETGPGSQVSAADRLSAPLQSAPPLTTRRTGRATRERTNNLLTPAATRRILWRSSRTVIGGYATIPVSSRIPSRYPLPAKAGARGAASNRETLAACVVDSRRPPCEALHRARHCESSGPRPHGPDAGLSNMVRPLSGAGSGAIRRPPGAAVRANPPDRNRADAGSRVKPRPRIAKLRQPLVFAPPRPRATPSRHP